MREFDSESLTELLTDCYENPGFVGGLLFRYADEVERVKKLFEDGIRAGRIDGAERIESDVNVELMARYDWIRFSNGSSIYMMSSSTANTGAAIYQAGHHFDRILFDISVPEIDRMAFLSLEKMQDTYDLRDWLPSLSMCVDATPDYRYIVSNEPWSMPTTSSATTYAHTTTSPTYMERSTTIPTSTISGPWCSSGTTFQYAYDESMRGKTWRRSDALKNALKKLKIKDESDVIDEKAFDSFMKKLENGEKLA